MKVICPSRPPTIFLGLQSWNPRKTSTMNLKPQNGGRSIKGAEMSIGAGDCHPEAVSAPSTAPTLHPLPTLLPGCRDREPQEAAPRTPRRGAGGGVAGRGWVFVLEGAWQWASLGAQRGDRGIWVSWKHSHTFRCELQRNSEGLKVTAEKAAGGAQGRLQEQEKPGEQMFTSGALSRNDFKIQLKKKKKEHRSLMIHDLWRAILQDVAKSFKICIYFDPAISLPRIHPKDLVIPNAMCGPCLTSPNRLN